MKKVLVCILVLVLCLTAFVACDPKDPQGPQEPQPSQAMQDAYDYLEGMFEDKEPVTPADYQLPGSVLGYDVTWTVEVREGDQNGAKIVTKDDALWVDVVDKAATDIKYTLTGTITEGEVTLQVVYNYTVPQFQAASWQEYVDACNAKDESVIITIKGYVIGINSAPLSSTKASLWVMDETHHGYYVYCKNYTDHIEGLTGNETDDERRAKIAAAYPIGTEVEVQGSVTNYGGVYEFNTGAAVTKTGNSVDPATLSYTDVTEAFGAVSDNAGLDVYQATRISVSNATMGVVDGKNAHFTVNGKDYVMYLDYYLIDEPTLNALKAMWVQGGKANLKGVCNVFGSVYQIYPDGADSIEVIQEQLTDAQKVERALEGLALEAKYNDDFTLPTSTWANVVWTVKSGNATITEGKVDITQTDASQEIVLTATVSSGDESQAKDFTFVVDPVAKSFIGECLKVAGALEHNTSTENSYMIIGTISAITEAYSEQYKNVTFKVSDGTNELLIYRYKGDDASTLKVGDAFACVAPLKRYNDDLEAVAPFEKLNITGIKAAADAGIAGTGVANTMVYGRISAIPTAYSEQYGNITITITDGTDSIDCYRLKGGQDLAVGMYVLVTGTPSAYNNKAQMAAGATYVTSAVYVPSDADKIADVKAELDKIAGTHNDNFVLPAEVNGVAITWASNNAAIAIEGVNATVTRGDADANVTLTATFTIGEEQNYEIAVKVEKVVEVTGDNITVTKTVAELATANSWGSDGSTKLSDFKLDDVITVAFTGGGNTGKVYSEIRMYQTETPTVAISAAEGYVIVSVKITYTTKNTGCLTNASGNVASDQVVTVNSQSVTFGVGNTGTATNGQAKITAIEVVYAQAA